MADPTPPPPRQPQAARTPDALLVPLGWKAGPDARARVNSVLDLAEPLMGRKCLFSHLGDRLFVTPFGADHAAVCFNYPSGHDRAGQPRYDWVDGPDGVRYGYLKDAPPPPAPAAVGVKVG